MKKLFNSKFFLTQFILKKISSLSFGIFLLSIIAITSSLGSIIEQDELPSYYDENYKKPIFGIINSSFILNFGLDHIYRTGWFIFLLCLFGISLISCTFSRQFPILTTSKEFFFKKKKNSFFILPFSIQLKNFYYLKEFFLSKIQNLNFYIYQKKDGIYGYRGLIGRISPILVHFSLIIILLGSSFGAFVNFKAQEILPKGDIFHIQNSIVTGIFSNLSNNTIRVNDFWVEYKSKRIHQFYSDLSVLDSFGKELKTETISVNHPLRYQNVDFYQSDWNLISLRIKQAEKKKYIEYPIILLKNGKKIWISWIKEKNEISNIIIDQFENSVYISSVLNKKFVEKSIGESLTPNNTLIEIISSTGLLIKYDPSINLIYFGFGILMITACLSYFPYQQIWIWNRKKQCWIGSSTNRGKIQLEIEFENIIRLLENQSRQLIKKKE